jgi:hypothetical protein
LLSPSSLSSLSPSSLLPLSIFSLFLFLLHLSLSIQTGRGKSGLAYSGRMTKVLPLSRFLSPPSLFPPLLSLSISHTVFFPLSYTDPRSKETRPSCRVRRHRPHCSPCRSRHQRRNRQVRLLQQGGPVRNRRILPCIAI